VFADAKHVRPTGGLGREHLRGGIDVLFNKAAHGPIFGWIDQMARLRIGTKPSTQELHLVLLADQGTIIVGNGPRAVRKRSAHARFFFASDESYLRDLADLLVDGVMNGLF